MSEPTDKDRLDWLDKNEFSAHRWPLSEDCVLFRGGLQHTGSIREAIDSAMAAERSGAPGAFGEGVG